MSRLPSLLLVISSLWAGLGVQAAPSNDAAAESELLYPSPIIRLLMQRHHLPGLSACIVEGDRVAWVGAYGHANIEEGRPVEVGTLFGLASVSKTVTGTALMQLQERGAFGLDDDVNDYLPFEVRNPSHPAAPITFRMLLTHQSSIRDNWDLMTYYWGRDSPVPMDEFLFHYLDPSGDDYDPDRNFFNGELPGSRWHYSNIGVVVAGYLVEVISGQTFAEYTRTQVFEPLEMDETAWFLADLDPSHIAMPYHWDGTRYVPYGFYGYADYAAGLLRTSVDQLAHHLIAYLNDGTYQGRRILEETTVDEILREQVSLPAGAQGLIWFYGGFGERLTWGHGGSDLGVATRKLLDREHGEGIIVLTNGENHAGLAQVGRLLFRFAGPRQIVTGCGAGGPNPNRVVVFDAASGVSSTLFDAYGAGQWGVRVAAGKIDHRASDSLLTGPGPGAGLGPHVRGFAPDGSSIPDVGYFAYATLSHGVNVSSADLDGDGFDEILSGAGPGAMFGPQVRGWNYDARSISALSGVNYYSYATLKYGVHVARGDLDADGYLELLTGAGPGAAFVPHVRGFDADVGRVAPLTGISFQAFASPRYGALIGGDDVDEDGYAEIAVAPGPGPANPVRVKGFEWDVVSMTSLPGFELTRLGSGFGARVGLGDLDGDARGELVVGAGPDPAASASVTSHRYDGSRLEPVAPAFTASGFSFGVDVQAGSLGWL